MKKVILSMKNVNIGDEKARYSLKNFHLHVYQGEMVNLLGISGSGKTALYYYFIGEESLRNGDVTYKNQTYTKNERFAAMKDIICLGRKSTLVDGLSIAENLCIITGKRKVKGIINKKALYYRINLLLDLYAPGLSANKKVSELTLVQRHIVELLRAIENEADLVYIDDAFSSYGQRDMHIISEILKVLKEKNITIIYASRKKDQMAQLSDRMILLRQGENVKTFYKENYNEEVFLKWLVGNPMISEFEHKSYATKDMIFRTCGLTGPKYITDMEIELNKGEIVGFYDMNNSANLEASSMMIGESEPILGEMYFKGKRYSPERLDDAIKYNFGYVPRERNRSGVVNTMSFAENLLLPVMLKMSLFSFLKNTRVSRYLEKEYLEEMGIKEEDKNRGVSDFDSYVKNNVIFRKWILAKPDILVCEEICEETDIEMRNIIYKALEELAQNGTAIIITSQNLGELKSICDSIYIMNSFGNEERVK
ncbi:MAG: ATP-binding cassette domain-containing protein, partial [Mobilitalea sp.]